MISGFSEGKQPEINSSDEDDQKTEKNLLNQSRKNPASIDFMANPSMLCTLCCAAPKNACLIHGRISHQVCCYGCAKKLFKNHRGCPVCRRKIEKITKNIIAWKRFFVLTPIFRSALKNKKIFNIDLCIHNEFNTFLKYSSEYLTFHGFTRYFFQY